MAVSASFLSKNPWSLLLAAVYLLQERLLSLPTRASMTETIDAADRLGLRPWPDQEHYYGLAGPPPANQRGTVLVGHGNAGSALDRAFYVQPLNRLGYQVVLPTGRPIPACGPKPWDS